MSVTGPGCEKCGFQGSVQFMDGRPLERVPCPECSPWGKPGATAELQRQAAEHKEQSQPKPNDLPFIKDLVVTDMSYRAELGKQRYNTYLQPHNGRDVLRDAYEEALDLCQYLRQALYERDGK